MGPAQPTSSFTSAWLEKWARPDWVVHEYCRDRSRHDQISVSLPMGSATYNVTSHGTQPFNCHQPGHLPPCVRCLFSSGAAAAASPACLRLFTATFPAAGLATARSTAAVGNPSLCPLLLGGAALCPEARYSAYDANRLRALSAAVCFCLLGRTCTAAGFRDGGTGDRRAPAAASTAAASTASISLSPALTKAA